MRRFVACLRKTLVESLRDWKITVFAVAFAPAFVFAMAGFYGRGNQPVVVAIVGAASDSRFVAQLAAGRYDDGVPRYTLRRMASREQALAALEDRGVDAVLIVPDDFDAGAARAVGEPAEAAARMRLYGDAGNQRYSLAAIYIFADLDTYLRGLSRGRPAVEIDETLTGQGSSITEFDAAVPGLVVFALLNVLLTAGAAFLREVDRGTIVRLALSRLRPWEFVGAISVVQAGICVTATMLALGAALAVGFPFRGGYPAMALLAIVSSVGVVGVALLTAACLKTMHDLLTVGVAPYFVIMFFSGLMFPMPRSVLVRLGDHVVRYQDLLPLAAPVRAFDRVMNYGAGVASLGFELALVGVVSSAWFVVGLWAFRRRHMRLV